LHLSPSNSSKNSIWNGMCSKSFMKGGVLQEFTHSPFSKHSKDAREKFKRGSIILTGGDFSILGLILLPNVEPLTACKNKLEHSPHSFSQLLTLNYLFMACSRYFRSFLRFLKWSIWIHVTRKRHEDISPLKIFNPNL